MESSLVIAVPKSWIDVDNIYDLIEISYEYKNNSENLKLATKYPNLVRRSLEKFDVNNIVDFANAKKNENRPENSDSKD